MNRGIANFYADLISMGENVYPYELFDFIYDTIYQISMAEKTITQGDDNFHISPKKICSLFSQRIQSEFGYFSALVLEIWGVKSSLDIGKAVMRMAEKKCLKLAGNETLEDFKQAGLNPGL